MFFVVDVNSSGFDQLVGFLDMASVTGNYCYDFEYKQNRSDGCQKLIIRQGAGFYEFESRMLRLAAALSISTCGFIFTPYFNI